MFYLLWFPGRMKRKGERTGKMENKFLGKIVSDSNLHLVSITKSNFSISSVDFLYVKEKLGKIYLRCVPRCLSICPYLNITIHCHSYYKKIDDLTIDCDFD